MAGMALLHEKLPPPCPTSNLTPRLRASRRYGRSFPFASKNGTRCSVHVRVPVAGTQVFGDQLLERTRRIEVAKIDRDRDIGRRARRDGAVHRRPLGPGEVRRLDADDDVRVLAGDFGRRLRVHVLRVLLDRRAAGHSAPDDVEHGEDARAGAVDHARLEVRKTAPPRRSQVDDRCHTAAEREAVRRETPIARVLRQHVGAVVDVDVNVHQAWRDEQARHVHHSSGVTRRNRVGDTRDLPGRDRHVHPAVDVAPRIDDVPTLEQQVVLRLRALPALSERQREGESKGAQAAFVKSTAAATIARRFISQSPCAGGYDTAVKRSG